MLSRRSEGPGGDGPVDIDLARAADFELGTLKLQPSTLQLQFDGATRTLEPRVMQVLIALASAGGAVVSRDRLVDSCWGGRAVSEDAINRCIAKVRRLGAESGAFEIETIPRVGYRLLENRAAEPAKARPGLRAWWLVAGGAIVLVAAAAGLVSNWRETGTGERPIPAIAVAGFTALNVDPDAKPYADSITASVSSALVDEGARLISADPRMRTVEEARRAGAALLIKGTVRRQGGTLHVTAVVESASDGSPIITKDYQVAYADRGSLPDHVAALLASTMWAWIANAPNEPDLAVNNQVLRITTLSDSQPLQAWALSRRLAAAKPNSAEAQANLARTTALWLDNIPLEQRAAAVSEARDAARRAAQLRPQLAFIDPCTLRPPGRLVLTAQCDAALRRAVAADPEPLLAALYFGSLLAQSGRLREADAMAEKDLEQAPLLPGALSGRMFFLATEQPPGRNNNELSAIAARVQRYWPELLKDATSYQTALMNGKFAVAEALLNDVATGDSIDSGVGKDIENAVFRAVRSRDPADVAAARRGCVPEPPNWGPPGLALDTCLVGFAALGDLDDAFAVAKFLDANLCCSAASEKAWLQHGGLVYPRLELWGTAMAPVRADPRFIEVARRTGLLAYWKSGHPPDFCSFERAPVCAVIAGAATAR